MTLNSINGYASEVSLVCLFLVLQIVSFLSLSTLQNVYMDLFRQKKAVICCGQGDWEQPDTTRRLKEIFDQKGIPVWVDLWGYDVKHDWDWWYQQVVYYMPYLMG